MCAVIFGVTTCIHAIYNTPVSVYLMSLATSFYSYSLYKRRRHTSRYGWRATIGVL
jgi:hypothetical protein